MTNFLRNLIFAAAATKVTASCAYGTHLSPRAAGGEVPINTFGYSGDIGPSTWHGLNLTTNAACAQGTNQSPIDLVSGLYSEEEGAAYRVSIPNFDAGAVFENLGTTVEVVGEGGNMTLPSSNKTFELAQFHFHLPSEHLDEGHSQAMEVHFVFQAADAELAVLGIYIDIGSDVSDPASEALETIFSAVGDITEPGTATTTPAIDMSGIISLMSATTFKTYSGSLTTPPCSEGVNWNVATDSITVSLDTWQNARAVIGHNARFVQNAPGETNVLSMAASHLASMSQSTSSTSSGDSASEH